MNTEQEIILPLEKWNILNDKSCAEAVCLSAAKIPSVSTFLINGMEGFSVVSIGGPLFQSKFRFETVVPIGAYRGEVFDIFHDDLALLAGTRIRGIHKGSKVKVRGQLMVVSNSYIVKADLPSESCAVDVSTVERFMEKETFGYWYHQELQKGHSPFIEKFGSFVRMKLGEYTMLFYKAAKRMNYVSIPDEFEMPSTRIQLPGADGQLSLF